MLIKSKMLRAIREVFNRHSADTLFMLGCFMDNVSFAGRNDGELVCNLCWPDITVYGEFLPGYVLGKNESGIGYDRGIPHGNYILFDDYEQHLFNWVCTPTYDPMRDLDYNLIHSDEIIAQEDKHVDNLDELEKVFVCDLGSGYSLMNECIKAGYGQQNDGVIMCWIQNRMAKLIEAYDASLLT